MNSYHCRIPILIYVTNDILEIASSSRVSSSFEHEWELDVRIPVELPQSSVVIIWPQFDSKRDIIFDVLHLRKE